MSSSAETAFTAHRLRCEYKSNPLGIDIPQPRLSWQIVGAPGLMQSAYQILVASTTALLHSDTGDLWDTGKVSSDTTTLIEYQGLPLASRQQVFWKVRSWDRAGQSSPWSEPATWEMGLVAAADWHPQWISLPDAPGATDYGARPAVLFRNTFAADKPIKRALIYITAHGIFELSINGHKVGDHWFDPGWTDYNKRIAYQTFDITAKLQAGGNAVAAEVAEGWWCGRVGFEGYKNKYGDNLELFAQIVIDYADGTTETIITDSSWLATTGPTTYAGFLAGEGYDARREVTGWSTIDCDTTNWSPVAVAPASDFTGKLVARVDPPIRVTKTIKPISIKQQLSADGTPVSIIDMGQNMVGNVAIKVSGEAGTMVTLRFVEVLNPDGTIYITNLRAAEQTDRYTLRGSGIEEWSPRFTFHGFRYVEVAGYPGELTLDSITGQVIHSDTEFTGQFDTDSDDINQLWRNIQWGQRGNFLAVPTDCPQRDERLGWTADAQIFLPTAAYNADVASFFTKWMVDIADAQHADGAFHDVAPRMCFVDLTGAPAWADAGVIIPWHIYQTYGDKDILRRQYSSMKAWVDYVALNNPTHLWLTQRGNDYGDWLSIDADTSKDVLATAFFAHSAELFSDIAAVLGLDDDSETYSQLSEAVKDTFRTAYISPGGEILSNTQTAYILALRFGLAPDLDTEFAERLIADIRRRGNRVSTGFLGVGHILHALTETGNASVAYDLLFQDRFPSWLYSIRQGATTIWERWDGWTEEKGFQDPGMNSFNHYALGSCGEWMYNTIAGIRAHPSAPGYKRIILAPTPDARLGRIAAKVESPHGSIESSWTFDGASFKWRATVPANTHAEAKVPTSDPASVTINGVSARDVAGVRPRGGGSGYVEFGLEPGTYDFASTYKL